GLASRAEPRQDFAAVEFDRAALVVLPAVDEDVRDAGLQKRPRCGDVHSRVVADGQPAYTSSSATRSSALRPMTRGSGSSVISRSMGAKRHMRAASSASALPPT